MDAHELHGMLQQVRRGELEPAEALKRLRTQGTFVETGDFAKVDVTRRLRCGFPEVIFGQGKTPEQIVAIMGTLRAWRGRAGNADWSGGRGGTAAGLSRGGVQQTGADVSGGASD